jgi:hypothetical protein
LIESGIERVHLCFGQDEARLRRQGLVGYGTYGAKNEFADVLVRKDGGLTNAILLGRRETDFYAFLFDGGAHGVTP